MKDYQPFNNLTSKYSTWKPTDKQIEHLNSFKIKLQIIQFTIALL